MFIDPQYKNDDFCSTSGNSSDRKLQTEKHCFFVTELNVAAVLFIVAQNDASQAYQMKFVSETLGIPFPLFYRTVRRICRNYHLSVTSPPILKFSSQIVKQLNLRGQWQIMEKQELLFSLIEDHVSGKDPIVCAVSLFVLVADLMKLDFIPESWIVVHRRELRNKRNSKTPKLKVSKAKRKKELIEDDDSFSLSGGDSYPIAEKLYDEEWINSIKSQKVEIKEQNKKISSLSQNSNSSIEAIDGDNISGLLPLTHEGFQEHSQPSAGSPSLLQPESHWLTNSTPVTSPPVSYRALSPTQMKITTYDVICYLHEKLSTLTFGISSAFKRISEFNDIIMNETEVLLPSLYNEAKTIEEKRLLFKKEKKWFIEQFGQLITPTENDDNLIESEMREEGETLMFYEKEKEKLDLEREKCKAVDYKIPSEVQPAKDEDLSEDENESDEIFSYSMLLSNTEKEIRKTINDIKLETML
eukprot:MONOS_4131.1-p1 / transcript=MONOS_4131.1 / gene=MONOS_4131 / organism=Monocercomonoides_exilis_PA203 / gene_product=unspecified product / transcript_product=unspecified product / location=Mono_scaffold00106:5779-7243(+) / protein_length=470 / sequence_SO=supercontig / SO=protein_coding / is_pseudo=false